MRRAGTLRLHRAEDSVTTSDDSTLGLRIAPEAILARGAALVAVRAI